MSAADPRYRWVVIGLFWVVSLVHALGGFSLPVMLPRIREDFDISPVFAGLLGGQGWQVTALLAIPFGAWLPRFPPRRLLVVIGAAAALFAFLQGLAPN